MPGTFSRHWLQRKPPVSDPGMHHGTCVMHVPWCMSGSLTCGGGENVPGILGVCATRNFAYQARGSWRSNRNIANCLAMGSASCTFSSRCTYPDSKVHWANMGSTWVLSAPGGPQVGPINFAIRNIIASNDWISHRAEDMTGEWWMALILCLWKISVTEVSGTSFITPTKYFCLRVFGAPIIYEIPVA